MADGFNGINARDSDEKPPGDPGIPFVQCDHRDHCYQVKYDLAAQGEIHDALMRDAEIARANTELQRERAAMWEAVADITRTGAVHRQNRLAYSILSHGGSECVKRAMQALEGWGIAEIGGPEAVGE